MNSIFFRCLCGLLLVCAVTPFRAFCGDQPQWGQAWSRNMVSSEKNLVDDFDPKTGRNIRWITQLGTETHSTPIIAGGRVYIGTNNGQPRDPKEQGDRGVLMCFDEKSGEFKWQVVVRKREEDPYYDWPNAGISSPVTVEGGRVYLVNSRGEVMCLDTEGKTIWLFNLTAEAGIWSHDAAHSSILIYRDHLYLNTGTGVDNTHRRIRSPEAPSLVVLDKKSGKLVARENERFATNIFHCTWSAPSMGQVRDHLLIFFAGGNGMIYGFEPVQKSAPVQLEYLRKVWEFDFDLEAPKGDIHPYLTNRREGPSNIYGMPVFYHERVYVAGGGDLFWGKNAAWLKCIDATRSGNISSNGLVWSYPLQRHVLSTPAIDGGLVFIADCGRKLHCLDAETGQPYWTHDIQGEAWASPLAADGKVYLGTRSGSYYVLRANKEKKVLSAIEMGSPISATTTAANGVLFIATMNRLYAVAKPPR